jgi:hypothetical protein
MKKVYRLYLRSTDVGVAQDFTEIKRFILNFEDKQLLNHESEYQVAVESFQFQTTNVDQFLVELVCPNLYQQDTYCSKNKGRGNTLCTAAIGSANTGFHQTITEDTVGIPCSALHLFNQQSLELQVRGIGGFQLVNNSTFGNNDQDGNWALTLVIYPIKK